MILLKDSSSCNKPDIESQYIYEPLTWVFLREHLKSMMQLVVTASYLSDKDELEGPKNPRTEWFYEWWK